MSKPTVFIDDWAVVKSGAYVAYEELEPGHVLTGKVFGHDRLAEGKSIFTSSIVRVDHDHRTVETKNTVYQLGRVSEDYRQSDEYKALEWGGEQTYAA